MNKYFRIVWSAARGAFVVAHERANGHGKASSTCQAGTRATLIAGLFAVSPTFAGPPADTLPSGGQIAAGAASISQSGNRMDIAQSSQNVIINWQGFNIGANAQVNFAQPNASAVALNRVVSSDPSAIYGKLSANGQVFLLNPNGVLFGAGSRVDVGGLVATTMKMANTDFMTGNYKFTGGDGSVVNQGKLTAAQGGYVALLAPEVRNEGIITASLGTVVLGGAEAVTLSRDETGIAYAVDKGAVRALVENQGLVQADGGQVLMSARAANELASTVINNSGTVQARTLQNRDGRILLVADMAIGETHVAGTLDASAPDGGKGGFIETSAAHVDIAPSTVIDTHASSGENGTWLIDPVDITIDSILAGTIGTALSSGNVSISTAGGNTPDTSSGESGTAGHITVNSSINWGANTLTLSAHQNITVNAALNVTGTGGLALEYGQTNTSGSGYLFTANAPINMASTASFSTKQGNTGAIKSYTILTSLGTAGSTSGTDLQGMSGNLAGNYVLGANIDASATASWNGNTGFLPVGNSSTPYTGKFDGLGHIVSGLTINRASWYQGLFGYASSTYFSNIGIENASINAGSASGVGTLVGAAANTEIYNAYAMGTVAGSGSVGGLVGLFSGSNNFIRNSHTNVVLSTSNPATSGSGFGGLAGQMVGTISDSYAVGEVLDSVAAPNKSAVGGLAGYLGGGVTNSYALGNVRGSDRAGGLVGNDNGVLTISKSFSKGRIIANGSAGGLLGYATSSISIDRSYATGDVLYSTLSGGYDFGGLVGTATGNLSITNAYALGNVNAYARAGGLVGLSGTSLLINSSYTKGLASATVVCSGCGTGQTLAGGLLGELNGPANLYGVVAYDGNPVPIGSWSGNWSLLQSSYGATNGAASLANMKIQATYQPAFDFTNIWTIDPAVNNGFPYLQGLRPQTYLTLALPDYSKAYGSANPSIAGAWSVTGCTGCISTFDWGGAMTIATGAGAYSYQSTANLFSIGFASGTAADYSISYSNNAITVNPLVLNLTADAKGKTYGAADPALTYQITSGSLINGDSLSGALARIAGNNVGVYAINQGTLANSNYAITYTPANLTINPAPLIITSSNVTKTYDGTTSASGTAAAGGSTSLFYGDSLTGGSFAFTDKNVGSGNKTVTVSGVTLNDGNSGSNYTVSYADNTTSTINPLGLTVTAPDLTKTYDGSTSAVGSATLGSLAAGDSINTAAVLAYLDKNWGIDNKTVRASGLTIKDAGNANMTGNYAISYVDNTTSTISKLALNVTAPNVSKTYDGSTSASGSATLGSLASGDSVNAAAILAFTDKNAGVGNKTVLASGLSIKDGSNADMTGNYAITYVADTASTINTRAVNVTVDAKTKTYGDADPALTYVAENQNGNRGLVSGDSFSGALNRVAGEDVNTYAIGQNTLANNNYAISFTGSSLTIIPRPITLTATAVSKIYDEADPALAVGITAGSLGSVTVSDVLSDVTDTLSRQAGNNAGVYDIALGSGGKAGNYAITFLADNNAFTIDRRPVNVTADAKSKVYGDIDPALTFVVESQSSGRGLVGGESLNGTLLRVVGETVLGGPYAINQGGVTDANNGNYVITYTGANLNITPKTLTLAGGSGVTKTYDGLVSMPLGNNGYGSLVGLVGGDTVTVSGAPVFDSANAGSHTVLQGTTNIAGPDVGNYSLIWTDGNGVVDKAPLIVTANADAKFVTLSDVPGYNGVSYSGFVNGETTAALTIAGLAIVRGNPAENNAGTYTGVLVPSGVTAGNYQISYVSGQYAIVPAGELLVRVNNTSTAYGTGPGYTIVSAQYMDGGTVIHTLAAPSVSGNTYTYDDGAGGTAIFTLGPLAPQYSTANLLKVGGYAIGASNVSETSANFSNALTVVGNLTVNQKAMSANASNVSKIYDGTTAMNGVVLGFTGLEAGDLVSISGNGNFSQKNVGTNLGYTVSSLMLGNADAGNYYLSGGNSLSGSNGEITKKTVNLSAIRTYDGSTALSAGTVNISTGVGGETLSYSGAMAHSKNVGSGNFIDAITLLDAMDASGGLASNYQLPNLAAVSAENLVDLAQKALTVSDITASDKTYDGTTNATLTLGSLSGLVSGEMLNLSGTGNFDTPAVGINKNVIVHLALADGIGGLAGNYSIADTSTLADINPAPNVVPPLPPSVPSSPTPPPSVPPMPDPMPVPGPGTPSDPSGMPGTPGAPSDPSAPPGSGEPTQLTLSSTGEVPIGNSGAENAPGNSSGFISVRTFGTLKVPTGTLFTFTLPKDTFKHADPKATVALEARGEDGRPLPNWLSFDPGTWRFTGKPPKDLDEFVVVVIARDNAGNEVSTKVVLRFVR